MYLACIHGNKVYVTILIVADQHGALSLVSRSKFGTAST